MNSETRAISDNDVHVKKVTPLPKKKIVVLCLVMFADFYGVILIFPFIPFMVSNFFPKLDRTEIGKRAGFIGSAYYIGSLAGSFMWGWLADIIGRRPTLLFCILGVIVSFTLFGFSQNFVWAVCSRLLWGLLDGIVGVSKTYISEICDETNQARGFALITTMGGVGRLFGSLTGGFLARPASKYSAFDIPFFCDFPYVLPCLVGVAANIISLIMAWLFLPETLKKPGHKTDAKKLGVSIAATNDGDLINDSMEPVSNDLIGDLEKGREHQPLLGLHEQRKNKSNRVKQLLKKAQHKVITVTNLMKDRRVFLSTTLYGLLGFSVIIYNEVYPLLMVTDHHHGGYDMDDNEIGIFLSVAAIFQVSYQVLLYPIVAKLLGYRNSFRLGAALFTVACILMPLANHISGPIGNPQSDNSNSTHGLNTTTWTIMTDDVTVTAVDYKNKHLQSFSPLYGSNYQSQNSTNLDGEIFNFVEYYGNSSVDNNNLTDNNCHSSYLGSVVGKNSVKRIPARVWLTLSWILTMSSIGRLSSFTSISVIIGNSALPASRGTVIGIGQTLAALGRSTGPLIGTPLFAWSEKNGHGWPLNHYFIYEVIAVMVIIIILVSFALPKSSEKKRLPDSDQAKAQATASTLSKKHLSVT